MCARVHFKVSQNQSAQNGTNGTHRIPSSTATNGGGAVKQAENNGVTSSAQVSKQVVPGPTSASHVVIDEKKNKKKGCCVVQWTNKFVATIKVWGTYDKEIININIIILYCFGWKKEINENTYI